MIEANEVHSTFYALRLLSHGLDTSQIEVTDGEEYPASEFTREEQGQALKIIERIENAEAASFVQLPPEKIQFYLTALTDRIEKSANSDLANAGYSVETNPRIPDEPDQMLMTADRDTVMRKHLYQKLLVRTSLDWGVEYHGYQPMVLDKLEVAKTEDHTEQRGPRQLAAKPKKKRKQKKSKDNKPKPPDSNPRLKRDLRQTS